MTLAAAAQDGNFGDTTHDITTQPGARIWVDGVLVGTAPTSGTLTVEGIAPGSHRVRVEREGFEPSDRYHEFPRLSFPPVNVPLESAVEPPPPLPRWPFALAAAAVLLLIVVVVRRKGPPRFDRYRVLRPLGTGGMATVFLASDRRRRVALKVMDVGLLEDPDLVRKFLKEGEVLQMIEATAPGSPVVRALRYGRENGAEAGRPFVALEYVPGETLLRYFRERGHLPVRHVLSVARQVCEGLAAAHAHGVWHRDVSPDNVLMTGARTGDGAPAVKLIDFGVAKHEYTLAKTLDGSISGKPSYMSPEQCRGQAVDGRSDLYSVGIMMYTMLAGHPPFASDNPLLVMRLHETAAVPPLPDAVPGPVRDLVMRLLAKSPADRPSSAHEVAAHLSALERTN